MTPYARFCFGLIIVAVAGNLCSGAQTVTLSFHPPGGAVVEIDRERTITTVNAVDGQTTERDVERTISLMGFDVSSEGYEVFEVAKDMSRTINGRPFDNPAHKFIIGRTNAFVVSPDADLLRLKGQDKLLVELKAFFPTNMHTELERTLGGERPYLQEKERWDRNMKRFVGRTLKEGDAWKETVSLPTTTNEASRRTYEANRVEKIEMDGPKPIITIVTFRSADRAEIERLDVTKMTMEEGAEFNRQPPERRSFTRVIQRRVFEANTLIPIHDERIWRGTERKRTEWAIVTERQAESFRRIK